MGEEIAHRQPGEDGVFLVKWGDIKFNVVELNTIRELGKELQRCAKDVDQEKVFLNGADEHALPDGMVRLGEEDDHIFRATFRILKNNLTLKNDVPLTTIDRTIDNYVDLDNEQIYNLSEPSRQFTEEDIHLVTEILNNQEDGTDVFLVYTPDLVNEEKCKEYVSKMGVKSADTVHIVLNVSPGRGVVNTDQQNGHWVYCAIKSEQEVIYGDPLGSRSIPTNLIAILNPIFHEKFGKNIVAKNVKVKNCSQNPNFPIQTCSTICGLVSVILCASSFSKDLYQEIFFSRTSNSGLDFIKNPSNYSSQIRMRLLKIATSRKHCVETLIPENMEYKYKEGDERLGNSYSTRKAKTSAPSAWSCLKSKSKVGKAPASKKSTETSSTFRPSNTPWKPSGGSECRPTATLAGPQQTTEMPVPSTPAAASCPPLPASSPSPSSSSPRPTPLTSTCSPPPPATSLPSISSSGSSTNDEPVPSSVSTTLTGEDPAQVVQMSFTGKITFTSAMGYPNNDGSTWTEKAGRKKKGAKHYVCNVSICEAEKSLFNLTKVDLRAFWRKKKPITVRYIKSHNCGRKTDIAKVSLASYHCQSKSDEPSVSVPDSINEEMIQDGPELRPTGNPEGPQASTEMPVPVGPSTLSAASSPPPPASSPPTSCSPPPPDFSRPQNAEPVPTSSVQTGAEPAKSMHISLASEPILTETSDEPPAEGDINIETEVPSSEEEFVIDFDLNLSGILDDMDNWTQMEMDVQDGTGNIEMRTNDIDFRENILERTEMNLASNCYICDFKASSMSGLQAHMLDDHDKLCQVCDYHTTTDALLRDHEVAQGHKKCPSCEFTANHEFQVQQHTENIHSQVHNINEEDIETSVQDSNGEQPSPGEDEVQGNAEREVISLLSRGHSVKRKGTKMDKKNKRIRIDQSIREAPTESMYDGDEDTNATKDDITNGSDSNSKDLDYEMEHSHENGINCVVVENYSHRLDQNEGNVAYLIENHTTNKKPISDRTNVNWGPSQTQRGKTTFYPCSGYFRCSNCEQKFTEDGKCSDCKIALTKSACNAKKYIYFFENACISEVF